MLRKSEKRTGLAPGHGHLPHHPLAQKPGSRFCAHQGARSEGRAPAHPRGPHPCSTLRAVSGRGWPPSGRRQLPLLPGPRRVGARCQPEPRTRPPPPGNPARAPQRPRSASRLKRGVIRSWAVQAAETASSRRIPVITVVCIDGPQSLFTPGGEDLAPSGR